MRFLRRNIAVSITAGLFIAVSGPTCIPDGIGGTGISTGGEDDGGQPTPLPPWVCDEIKKYADLVKNDLALPAGLCDIPTDPAKPIGEGDSPFSKFDSADYHASNTGYHFWWDRQAKEVILRIFINAADPRGASIANLEAGDEIWISSASGEAAFRHKDEVEVILSFIEFLAAGAGLIDENWRYFGSAGVSLADQLFDEVVEDEERTDVSGVYLNGDNEGRNNRQGGGIIVCLPQAGGPRHSGSSRREAETWFKSKFEPRVASNYPPRVSPDEAFFYRQGDDANNRRTLTEKGEVYILAWDYDFDNNVGYYTVMVHLTRGEASAAQPAD